MLLVFLANNIQINPNPPTPPSPPPDRGMSGGGGFGGLKRIEEERKEQLRVEEQNEFLLQFVKIFLICQERE